MTSRKGDSRLLNLDCEPKAGSMSNFMLHIATPSYTAGNMHPTRIITVSRNGHLENTMKKIKLVTKERFQWALQADKRTKSF